MIQSEVEKCGATIEDKSFFNYKTGGFMYHKCTSNAKYKVKYKDGIRGGEITDTLCGLHFRSLQKNSERLKRKTGFDNKLEFTAIT